VPEQEETPAPPPPAEKCQGARCKKKTARVEEPPDASRSIRARIAGIVESGGDVQIRIDQGANQGIEVGWKGMVVSRDGKAIAGGTFEVSRVSPSESFAVVRSSASSVTAAKYVRLQPP
jgi:citrate lyase gamma subunit